MHLFARIHLTVPVPYGTRTILITDAHHIPAHPVKSRTGKAHTSCNFILLSLQHTLRTACTQMGQTALHIAALWYVGIRVWVCTLYLCKNPETVLVHVSFRDLLSGGTWKRLRS